MESWDKTAKELSEDHVNWFLGVLKPLLIDHMIHGFKHGLDYKELNDNQQFQSVPEKDRQD